MFKIHYLKYNLIDMAHILVHGKSIFAILIQVYFNNVFEYKTL